MPRRTLVATFAWAPLLATLVVAGCAAREPASWWTPPARPPAPDGADVVGVVAADHPQASAAGARILDLGGNAVDAAVATSFALSVVRPYSCGVGGGGFMVIHLIDDPRTPGVVDPVKVAIDYRERAPQAVGPDHFLRLPADASRHSGHAVAVPGTVAGLLYALDQFGSLDRADVLAPAIELARRGFTIDDDFRKALGVLEAHAGSYRTPDAPGGPAASTAARQGRLLELIAAQGRDAFYKGAVGRAVVRAVRDAGGVMTLADLAAFEPKEVAPLVRTSDWWRGRTFITMPPPSSGGVAILQVLTMRPLAARAGYPELPPEALGQGDWSFNEQLLSQELHLRVEMMKHAFADRAAYLGDPEFVDVPIDELLSDARLRRRVAMIRDDRTFGPPAYELDAADPAALEDAGTSHFCVVDGAGNAVSCTETINLRFGSKIEVPEWGFFLNNQMDDFATRPGQPNAYGLVQSDRNAPAPGKRPLSSMSPMIVLDRDGKVEIVAGASGGPRIITGTLWSVVAAMYGESAADALQAFRIHHQWRPNVLRIETPADPDVAGLTGEAADRYREFLSVFTDRGHVVEQIDAIGVVQMITRRPDGVFEGAADPRKGGAPAYSVR